MKTRFRMGYAGCSIVSLIVFFLLMGCATEADNEQVVEQTKQSLTYEDCKDDAVDCTRDCIDGPLGDRLSCLSTCHDDFHTCISSADTPVLPDPGELVNCVKVAKDCIVGGGDIVGCRDDFKQCAEDAVPILGDLPDPLDVASCVDTAKDCLIGGGSIWDCRDDFETCMETAVPILSDLPELTDLPTFECADAFKQCLDDGTAEEQCKDELKTCVDDQGFDLPEIPNPIDGLNCIHEAKDCLVGGGAVKDCREDFGTCIDDMIPELGDIVPELPESQRPHRMRG